MRTDKGKEKKWEFDQVFGSDSTQEQVYKEVSGSATRRDADANAKPSFARQVSPLVTSVLDGFNVCIFAYGQTGTGKTFTMMGPAESRGVNTRALYELFEMSDKRRKTIEDKITVSVLEVYNEQIKDLLADDVGERKYVGERGARRAKSERGDEGGGREHAIGCIAEASEASEGRGHLRGERSERGTEGCGREHAIGCIAEASEGLRVAGISEASEANEASGALDARTLSAASRARARSVLFRSSKEPHFLKARLFGYFGVLHHARSRGRRRVRCDGRLRQPPLSSAPHTEWLTLLARSGTPCGRAPTGTTCPTSPWSTSTASTRSSSSSGSRTRTGAPPRPT